MIEIEEMSDADAKELFRQIGYGHLACSSEDQPYVVPIHYSYDGEFVYIYTTEGRKSDILDKNPEICLQAEKIEDNENWKSVMAFGSVERLSDEAARQKALDEILNRNPKLTPAVSVRWMDGWVRENIEVILRFRPRSISGRSTSTRQVGPIGRSRIA